ncbi:hypothetical protein G6F35_007930 [Rhizopus arrhizus]|nr:hypothetical protein G6F35_007930 [Rhizopus arrhizus]
MGHLLAAPLRPGDDRRLHGAGGAVPAGAEPADVPAAARIAGPGRRCAAAAADERGAALPAAGHQAVWPGGLRAHRNVRAEHGHAAGRTVGRARRLAVRVLADRAVLRGRHGDGRLGPAAGPDAPGALCPVQRRGPGPGVAGTGDAGAGPDPGRAPELVRFAADHGAAWRRHRPAGVVLHQRVVPPAAVLQAATAGPSQSQLFAGHLRGRAVRAAGGHLHPLRLSRQCAGLPPAADRADVVVGGAAAGHCVAAGGCADEPACGGLPLGAGGRAAAAGGGVLPGRTPGCAVEPRHLPVGATAAGGGTADGGAAVAAAGDHRAGAAGRSLCLGLVQHLTAPPPFHRAGRPPGQPAVAARQRRSARTPARPGAGAHLGGPVLAGRAGGPGLPAAAAVGHPCPPATCRGLTLTRKDSPMSLNKTTLNTGLVLGVLALATGSWLLLRDGRYQRTDNAYVNADFTVVAPKVAGFVSSVEVDDNQPVKAGDVLARIDDRDYQVALQAARADLANARAQLANAQAALAQQGSLIEQARASVDVSRSELTLASADQQRYRELARDGAGTVQNAQQAQSKQAVASAHLQQGQAALSTARQRIDILTAGVQAAQAAVQRAEAAQARAELDLSHTVLRAPIDGMVGRRAVRAGAYLTPGTPVAAVVP